MGDSMSTVVRSVRHNFCSQPKLFHSIVGSITSIIPKFQTKILLLAFFTANFRFFRVFCFRWQIFSKTLPETHRTLEKFESTYNRCKILQGIHSRSQNCPKMFPFARNHKKPIFFILTLSRVWKFLDFFAGAQNVIFSVYFKVLLTFPCVFRF